VNRDFFEGDLNSCLEGKYWGIIDRRNLLFFRKASIEGTLLSKYPNLEKVEVKKDFPDKIEVAVTERESGIILVSNGRNLAIDQKGVAYQEVDLDNPEEGLEEVLTLHDQSEKQADLGSSIIDKNYIEYLISVREHLRDDFEIEIQKRVETPSIVSFDTRFTTLSGWQIFFDQSIPLEKELEMLRVVLENKIPPEKRDLLEYIDLRLDNKVYYKFKDEESSGEEIKKEDPSEEKSAGDVPKEESKKDKKKKK
jgi:hypothetical protein